MDERVSAVGVIFANIIGVNRGFLEWCPNSSPASSDELLAWLWVIRPDLHVAISQRASPELAEAIRAYETTS
jgi:hypothetical protein